MRYRRIPGTDLEPSVICMGGGPLCRQNDDETVFHLLDTYYALGGNIIDSANIYGKWFPSGENVCDINIGKWLKTRKLHSKVIVTSKGGHPPLDSMTKPRLQREEVLADLEESLTALGGNCIDLYYLHRDDESVPVETVVDYLNGFVRQGLIRYFAASNWHPSRIAAAQAYAEESGQQGFCANQLMWSLAVPDMSKTAYPMLHAMNAATRQFHEDSGMTAIAYESQARGYFHKLNTSPAAISDSLRALYASAANTERYARASSLAKALDVSIGEIVLGYVLNQVFPSIAIIGSHTTAQIEDSVRASEIILTQEQVAFLGGEIN